MLSGINTDVKFQDKIYHVQTEDGGLDNPVVVTTLFERGAILASRKTNYADRLKVDKLSDEIRELIKKQHQAVVDDLMAGKFTGAHKTADRTAGVRDKKAAKKTLDELIVDYFATKKENTAQ